MKKVILFVLFAIILNALCYWVIQLADDAYENRAKMAGYELPAEQVRK